MNENNKEKRYRVRIECEFIHFPSQNQQTGTSGNCSNWNETLFTSVDVYGAISRHYFT